MTLIYSECVQITYYLMVRRILTVFARLILCVGDFNNNHNQCGYSSDYNTGIRLNNWAETDNLNLVFDVKARNTFFSGRWTRV